MCYVTVILMTSVERLSNRIRIWIRILNSNCNHLISERRITPQQCLSATCPRARSLRRSKRFQKVRLSKPDRDEVDAPQPSDLIISRCFRAAAVIGIADAYGQSESEVGRQSAWDCPLPRSKIRPGHRAGGGETSTTGDVDDRSARHIKRPRRSAQSTALRHQSAANTQTHQQSWRCAASDVVSGRIVHVRRTVASSLPV